MTNQLSDARGFMAGNARLLDRRRFELLFDGGDPEPVLAALRAYRNPDGGYGHGLEPDLRARESQPSAALHAFEVFAEIAPVRVPEAVGLCDWLDSIALPDGGLPFALPIEDASGCAPFWTHADPRAFSLQITAIVAATRIASPPTTPRSPHTPGSRGPRAAALPRSMRSRTHPRHTSFHSRCDSSTPSMTAKPPRRRCWPGSASMSPTTAGCA